MPSPLPVSTVAPPGAPSVPGAERSVAPAGVAPAWNGVPPVPGPWRRRVVGGGVGCAAVLLTACVVFLVVASIPDPTALGISVVAAIVPALVYAALVLRLDRYEREPWRVLLAAFGWGAIGAVVFSVFASLALQTLLLAAVAPETGTFLSVAVVAPLVEETFKGVALLAALAFFRRELDNVLDGLVYGALIGLGFAMTENVLYFGGAYLEDGMAGLGQLFVARAVINGFGHAAYTATTGAAVGWSRRQYRRGARRVLVPVLGWTLAVIQHALWNGGVFVVAGWQGDGATLLSVVVVEALLFVLPAILVLALIARVAARRELAVIRDQLTDEVARGVLSPAEHTLLADAGRRAGANRAAQARGGRPLRRRQQRFYHVAAELAFRKHHLAHGERPTPGQRAPEDAYRAELAALRAELTAAGLPAPTA